MQIQNERFNPRAIRTLMSRWQFSQKRFLQGWGIILCFFKCNILCFDDNVLNKYSLVSLEYGICRQLVRRYDNALSSVNRPFPFLAAFGFFCLFASWLSIFLRRQIQLVLTLFADARLPLLTL